ncbi:RNA binding protein Pym [Phlyctochytrium arcticum]|nr:RNA binding protein Pym [Phlyctochytrium arcticum]
MSKISGIISSGQSGERVVPASRRPDGSLRPERKVRPGYVAPEDAVRYTNAKVEATRVPEGYVPGLGALGSVSKGGESTGAISKSAKKNAKRKAKKTEEGESLGTDAAKMTSAAATPETAVADTAASEKASEMDQAALEKRMKNLRKKHRQITDLAAKDPSTLLPEQAEKLASQSAVEREIADVDSLLAKLLV